MIGKRRTITCSLRYMVALTIAIAAVVLCLVLLLSLQVNDRTKTANEPTGFDPARSWGYLSAYEDNTDSAFGVNDIGVPQGCQIIQAHILQRSAQRLPLDYFEEGTNDQRFAQKVAQWRLSDPNHTFTGSLAFLNTYEYSLNNSGALTRTGAATEFTRGSAMWNRYGRDLYSATQSQMKPFIRSAGSDHVIVSVPYWLAGFSGVSQSVGKSFDLVPSSQLDDIFQLPETDDQNNTLASYISCPNANVAPIDTLGDLILENYIPVYLQQALARLQPLSPWDFGFSVMDLYAMQSLCAFETNDLGTSPFCPLFTISEWEGYEQTFDQSVYYDCSFGSPTGRAQGIGYLQELIARLTQHFVTVSNTTVNATSDDQSKDFPLDRKMYVDFTHDGTIVSLLTAMSMDYFKDPPGKGTFPVRGGKRFNVADIAPSGANVATEVIACQEANPKPQSDAQYCCTTTQSINESRIPGMHRYVRMRLNNGILPLDSIRGGRCEGRSDGLCPLDKFLESQSNAFEESNFAYACYGDYADKISDPTSGKDWDGTIREGAAA